MNPKAKGSRNERKSRDLLTALGYNVTKSGGSLGQWDLIGIGTTDAVLVQVKSNRPPCPAEREALEMFPCPQNFRKLIHVWKDYARQPQVQVVGVCARDHPQRSDRTSDQPEFFPRVFW